MHFSLVVPNGLGLAAPRFSCFHSSVIVLPSVPQSTFLSMHAGRSVQFMVQLRCVSACGRMQVVAL